MTIIYHTFWNLQGEIKWKIFMETVLILGMVKISIEIQNFQALIMISITTEKALRMEEEEEVFVTKMKMVAIFNF